MGNSKTFIYISDSEYFKKTINLKKQEIRTSDVYFNLDNLTFFDGSKKDKEIRKEMKKLVSDYDVIMSSSDFDAGDVIVTTGGVILADELPARILNKANIKRNNRIYRINKNFIQCAYYHGRAECFSDDNNRDLIENLLLIHRNLLIEHSSGNTMDYITLLNCLIESPEPFKSGEYDKDIKYLLKEYSFK